ncbi:MAG: Gfo/Idh/MocA family oxidoreductase [Paramuribaculum sp.]|nr:Gfo/Idh/MocA family oxidoreductase [Paramuribaculum sp.]
MGKPVDIAIIGAGNRGCKYLHLLAGMPDKVTVAAIVEPDARRAAHAATILRNAGLPEPVVFADCEDMLSDCSPTAAIIATPERGHYSQAMQLLDKRVNILIEKPVATTIEECEAIAEKAKEAGVVAGVCHVLRYHPYFSELIRIATDGSLGEVVSVSHRLGVGIDRACHTFVRGPWGIPRLTSSMILSKGCHDLDLVTAITGSRAEKVYSVGGKHFFTGEKRPAGAAARCINCTAEKDCRFSAVDLYRRRKEWIGGFIPADSGTVAEEIERQLREGNYGRCVFACENEAVDRQIVTVAFENGAVATVTMNLFTAEDSRDTHICLTGGEIHGNGRRIKIFPLRGEKTVIDFSDQAEAPYHAGADKAVLEDFIKAITTPGYKMLATIDEVMESHRICMLATV